MLMTIVSFVFVLGVLVLIHELGHFLVAKKAGIFVEKFSIGFPPYIFKKKWGETEYCIGAIPLGGFVKMAGENPEEESTGAENEFMSKSVGARAAVLFAGPFSNYVLAVLIFIGIFYFKGVPVFEENNIVVGIVDETKPAYAAGLRADDRIIGLNGVPVNNFDSLRFQIYKIVNSELSLQWVHGSDTVTKNITTTIAEAPNKDGGVDTLGIIGFAPKPSSYEYMGFTDAVASGFDKANYFVVLTLNTVKSLITAEVSVKELGGPVFIAKQSGNVAKEGIVPLLFFMALLSVNLGVLNILPIPVLDGGHLVFLAIEKIKGSPVSVKGRMYAQQVGVFLLLGLILVVTFNDIVRVFAG